MKENSHYLGLVFLLEWNPPTVSSAAYHKRSESLEDLPSFTNAVQPFIKCLSHFAPRLTKPQVSASARMLSQMPSSCNTAAPKNYTRYTMVIQSSFSNVREDPIKASDNGFVWSAIQAYNHHHNLIIRPDDFWLAILTQFNIYVTAHVEKLRRLFVAHDGHKELEITAIGTTWTYDWAQFPRNISELTEKNVTDPELRAWIIPNFSTTREKDKVVCSIVMMSTLRHYFT